MDIAELAKDFKLNIKRISPLNYIVLNGRTMVLNDDELEDLEHGLVNLAHAISVYKRARIKND